MWWKNLSQTLFWKLKLSISLEQEYKVSCSLFFFVSQVERYRNALQLSSKTKKSS